MKHPKHSSRMVRGKKYQTKTIIVTKHCTVIIMGWRTVLYVTREKDTSHKHDKIKDTSYKDDQRKEASSSEDREKRSILQG